MIADPQQGTAGPLPLLWSEVPGTFRGMLTFRVGWADETAAARGITHLVEHLALFPLGRRPFEYNGRVEDCFTSFWATGRQQEVEGFLVEVARNLHGLPLDRLPTEKRVLRAEGAGEGGVLTRLLDYRFGATGFGLGNYPELGLRWLDPDSVSAWAGTAFTAENAVAWLSGPPSEGFTISLPSGARRAAPPTQPLAGLRLPAALSEGWGGLGASMIDDRSMALRAAIRVAAERLHDRLRRQQGLAYSPSGDYFPLDHDVAHVFVGSDCEDRNAPAVRDELLGVLDELAESGARMEEIEWDRGLMLRAWSDPEAAIGNLETSARDMLFDHERLTVAGMLSEHEALTPEVVAGALRRALDSMILLLPGALSRDEDRFSSIVIEEAPPVEGKVFKAAAGESFVRKLEMAETALTLHLSERHVTVSYDDVVAAVENVDGSLTLIRGEGTWARLNPAAIAGGAEALRTVRASVEGRVVPLDEDAERVARVIRDALDPLVLATWDLELEDIPAVLAQGEGLENVAIALKDKVAGVLALSDSRLFFLPLSADVWEDERQHISAARVRGIRNKWLEVTTPQGTTTFAGVTPPPRLRELAAALG